MTRIRDLLSVAVGAALVCAPDMGVAMDRATARGLRASALATGDAEVIAAVRLLGERGLLARTDLAPPGGRLHGSVFGTANGHPVSLQSYANGVFGSANGQSVSLSTYANGVFGSANGHSVSLSTYANGVFGSANGQSVSLSTYGDSDARALALAVALSLPVAHPATAAAAGVAATAERSVPPAASTRR